MGDDLVVGYGFVVNPHFDGTNTSAAHIGDLLHVHKLVVWFILHRRFVPRRGLRRVALAFWGIALCGSVR